MTIVALEQFELQRHAESCGWMRIMVPKMGEYAFPRGNLNIKLSAKTISDIFDLESYYTRLLSFHDINVLDIPV